MNVQFAVPRDGAVYVLEVNPRASRTVPFVSKAIGVPLAKIAARDDGRQDAARARHRGSRAAARLGQGGGVPVREVRGRRHHPRPRDALDRRGHGHRLRLRARVRQEPARRRHQPADAAAASFLSVRDSDKPGAVAVAKGLRRPRLRARRDPRHRELPASRGLEVKRVNKVLEGRPHCVDAARRRDPPRHQHDRGRAGDQGLVLDPAHRPAQGASRTSRRCRRRAPPWAPSRELRSGKIDVRSLQEYREWLQVPDDARGASRRCAKSSSGCARSSAPRTSATSRRRAPTATSRRTPSTTPPRSAGVHRGALARHRDQSWPWPRSSTRPSSRAARSCSAPPSSSPTPTAAKR